MEDEGSNYQFAERGINNCLSENKDIDISSSLEGTDNSSTEDTIYQAFSKIHVARLQDILKDAPGTREHRELLMLGHYFGSSLSGISASQFRAVEMFKNPLADIADVPVCYLPKSLYETLVEWMDRLSCYRDLSRFVVWSVDCILVDMEKPPSGSKGVMDFTTFGILVVLALLLRRKPDALIDSLPKLRENGKLQLLERLGVMPWMMVQACHEDVVAGFHVWSYNLLPLLRVKPGSNTQLRDFVFPIVERIMDAPDARDILVSNASRRAMRLIPPTLLYKLLHLTFPSARGEETERLERIYSTLKEVALSGDPNCSKMIVTIRQIQIVAIKAVVDGSPTLSEEAIDIFLWTLTQNRECCLQWGEIYEGNTKASVAILRKLLKNWNEHSRKIYCVESLAKSLKKIRQKNEKALSGGVDTCEEAALFKESDGYCKAILRKGTCGEILEITCSSFVVVFVVAGAVFFNRLASFLKIDEAFVAWIGKKEAKVTEKFFLNPT